MTSFDLKLIQWIQENPELMEEVKAIAENLLEYHWKDPAIAYDKFEHELVGLVLHQEDLPKEFTIESITKHGRTLSLIPDMEIIANEIMHSLIYGGEIFSVSGEEVVNG